jgi:hypothetical protein
VGKGKGKEREVIEVVDDDDNVDDVTMKAKTPKGEYTEKLTGAVLM